MSDKTIIDEVDEYIRSVPLEMEDEVTDLLKKCLEQMKDDRYFMTEIRAAVRPIIQNSQNILESATQK